MPRPGNVVWFTGLPASGKTTLAQTARKHFLSQDIKIVILDSDELRTVLTPEPTFSASERDWFYRVIVFFARLLAESGVDVFIAATGHRRRYRDQARRQIERFAEVYVKCDVAVCRQRDPKGIYALATAGKAHDVPGIGAEYEPPLNPLVVVDTAVLTLEEAAGHAIRALRNIMQPSQQRK